MSLSTALNQGSQALQVYSAGLAIAGNNVANANTPGFTREELITATGFPTGAAGQQIGGGVRAVGVRRTVDHLLNRRLLTAAGQNALASETADLADRLDATLGELTDGDLSTALSDFSAAAERVAAEPTSTPLRAALVEQGERLAGDLRATRSRAADLGADLTTRSDGLIDEANGLIEQVDGLNRQIVKLERGGQSPSRAGALRDQRFNAIRRLSEIIPLDFSETAIGSAVLRTGPNWLVLGDQTQALEVDDPDPGRPGLPVIRTTETRGRVPVADGGELGGVLTAADEVVGGFLTDLDTLAAGLIETVNRVHTGGRGRDGVTSAAATRLVPDVSAPLNDPANVGGVGVARGLPFAPTHGGFTVTVIDDATGSESASRIGVDLDGLGGDDTSLTDLIASLNSVDGVSASADARGRLSIEAAPGSSLAFADDTSGVLAAVGINTFFDGADAASIAVSEPVRQNPGLLATGRGGGVADNTNAAALAEALAAPVAGSLVEQFAGQPIAERWGDLAAAVSRRAQNDRALADGAAAHLSSLEGQREQLAGVSLDEEAARILQLQQQYQATAQVISTAGDLFESLLAL